MKVFELEAPTSIDQIADQLCMEEVAPQLELFDYSEFEEADLRDFIEAHDFVVDLTSPPTTLDEEPEQEDEEAPEDSAPKPFNLEESVIAPVTVAARVLSGVLKLEPVQFVSAPAREFKLEEPRNLSYELLIKRFEDTSEMSDRAAMEALQDPVAHDLILQVTRGELILGTALKNSVPTGDEMFKIFRRLYPRLVAKDTRTRHMINTLRKYSKDPQVFVRDFQQALCSESFQNGLLQRIHASPSRAQFVVDNQLPRRYSNGEEEK